MSNRFALNFKRPASKLELSLVSDGNEELADLTYRNDTVEGAIQGCDELLNTLSGIVNELNSFRDNLDIDLNYGKGIVDEISSGISEAAMDLGVNEVDIWDKLDGRASKEVDRAYELEETRMYIQEKINNLDNLEL